MAPVCYRRVPVPHAVRVARRLPSERDVRRRRCPPPPLPSRGAGPASRGRGRTLPVRGGEVFVRHTPWTGPSTRRTTREPRANAPCTCTAWAAPRPTGPTSRRCSPSGSRAGRWTSPASAAPGRRCAGATRSGVTSRRSIDVLEHIVQRPGAARRRARPPARQLPRRTGQRARRHPPSRPRRLADADLPGDAGLPRAAGVQPRDAAAPAAGRPVARRAADGRHRAGGACAADDPDVLRRPGAGAARAGRAGGPGDAGAGGPAVGRPRADPQHARADHLLPARGPGQRVAGGAGPADAHARAVGQPGQAGRPGARARASPPPSPTAGCWSSRASGTSRCWRRRSRPPAPCSAWSRRWRAPSTRDAVPGPPCRAGPEAPTGAGAALRSTRHGA